MHNHQDPKQFAEDVRRKDWIQLLQMHFVWGQVFCLLDLFIWTSCKAVDHWWRQAWGYFYCLKKHTTCSRFNPMIRKKTGFTQNLSAQKYDIGHEAQLSCNLKSLDNHSWNRDKKCLWRMTLSQISQDSQHTKRITPEDHMKRLPQKRGKSLT